MLPVLDRVYVNDRARTMLGWLPRFDFQHVLRSVSAGADPRSELARLIGSKSYHP
jgi:UDP-glucose 4-epimerase